MGAAFLITLREGLEMALIVAIVLGHLRAIGEKDRFPAVWAGTGSAALLAAAAGAVIFIAVGDLEGRAEEIVEGLVALAAAGVLTWMVFWMRRQARSIKTELHTKVEVAVASGSAVAVGAIAFFAVLREGLETSLFLIGASVGSSSSLDQAIGGFAGLIVAFGIGVLIYQGSRRINLRSFFRTTGVLVLLFAAGLLATAIHELQEAGFIGTVHEHVWNLSGIGWLDPDHSRFAEFLRGLFGWRPAPSLEMVLAYVVYVVPVAYAFLSETKGMPSIRRRAEAAAGPAPAR